MQRKRELFVTNLLAILVLVGALLAGWWDAALFGLGVLVVMDLLVVARQLLGKAPRGAGDSEPGSGVDHEEPKNTANMEQSVRRDDQR